MGRILLDIGARATLLVLLFPLWGLASRHPRRRLTLQINLKSLKDVCKAYEQ